MYILVTDYEKHWDNIIGKTSYPRGYDSYIEPAEGTDSIFLKGMMRNALRMGGEALFMISNANLTRMATRFISA